MTVGGVLLLSHGLRLDCSKLQSYYCTAIRLVAVNPSVEIVHFSSLAFVGEDLYAARDDLYYLDLDTCSMTTIGATGAAIYDIAYDSTNDILFGCDLTRLFTCDTASGACTVIGDLGYRCAGLAYVEETNTLYGSGFDGLYTINDVSNPSDVTLLTGISPYWVANGLAYMTF